MFYVYILKSTCDGSLYTGQTKDLRARILRHNKGYVKSTKYKIPYHLGYFEMYATRAEAMWREWEFKTKINTDQKNTLISEFDNKKNRRNSSKIIQRFAYVYP
jgi:putative endonuclease